MQIPILSGIYADQVAHFRTSYPRNLVPVPKQTGISSGYLRPAEGAVIRGSGPGTDRGGRNWLGNCYRVMGTKLVLVAVDGTVTVLGDVGPGGQVTMDEGFGFLAIWSGGRLYYWDGVLTQVTDPDLGVVIDGCWIGGYVMSTDGTNLVVTELNDRTQVNPLKYGSSEADPDKVLAISELRNEVYAFNRYSIEVFQNVGGANFPFQRVDGAQVPRGLIGTHAYSAIAETFMFLGGGKGEAPGVYIVGPGSSQKVSTAEIDRILLDYTEDELAGAVAETKVDKGHSLFMLHLPDQCLVYDVAGSAALGEPDWFTLDSGMLKRSTYRLRNLVWCYDRWLVADSTSTSVGELSSETMEHFGQKVGWEFGTMAVYNEGRGVIIHQLELVALPGRVDLGEDPTIWHSYSLDGQKWSQEHPIEAGKQGETLKRLARRRCGKARNYRMERFRGTSDARISMARLEAQVEALNG